MSESPDSLRPPRPQPNRMSKKPLYWVLAGALLMGGVLYYSINVSQQKEKEMEEQAKQATTDGRPLTGVDGPGGLALTDMPKDSGVARPDQKTDSGQAGGGPIVTVVATSTKEDEAAAARRKKQEQTYTVALMSPLVPHRGVGNKGGQQGQTASSAATAEREKPETTQMPQYQPTGTDAYNPAADVDKENFFSRSGDQGDKGWLSPYTREAGRQFEVKTGAVIPAVMVTGINSDLPGSIIAQVSQNVYDTATGTHLLIPQGAKLYGVYDARVVYGQSRVLIGWNRVIFPDGSSVTLGAMPGADMSGYSGFEDEIDNHYLRIFGSAILMSLITGGSSYAIDKLDNTQEDETTMQSSMGAAFAAQLGQATTRLLEKNLNIKPTLTIRPGYQFNVVVVKDVAFREPYREISMKRRR